MTNTLVDDLTDFPGAPFGEAVIDGAVGGLRIVAGWHIAPSVDETLTLDSHGGTRLVLPSLYVTDVTEVRDLSGDDPVVIPATDYRWSKAGILSRSCGWPCGFQSVEVDLVHGYAACPPELLSSLAQECQAAGTGRNVAASSAGPFSVTYRDASGEVTDPVLSRYTLPSRP